MKPEGGLNFLHKQKLEELGVQLAKLRPRAEFRPCLSAQQREPRAGKVKGRGTGCLVHGRKGPGSWDNGLPAPSGKGACPQQGRVCPVCWLVCWLIWLSPTPTWHKGACPREAGVSVQTRTPSADFIPRVNVFSRTTQSVYVQVERSCRVQAPK